MRVFKFFALIGILIFTGCSITQEYHFNNDFSGNYNFEMNMGDMISMLQSMDTTGAFNSLDTLEQSFDQIKTEYSEAGAKDIQVGWKNDKSTIFISFSFDNLESLNGIIENSSNDLNLFAGNTQTQKAKFSNKGKNKINIDFPETSKDSATMSGMEGMQDYLTIETIFSFDRQIKKTNNPNAKFSDDKKSIRFEGKMNDFIKEGYTMDSQIKLKSK